MLPLPFNVVVWPRQNHPKRNARQHGRDSFHVGLYRFRQRRFWRRCGVWRRASPEWFWKDPWRRRCISHGKADDTDREAKSAPNEAYGPASRAPMPIIVENHSSWTGFKRLHSFKSSTCPSSSRPMMVQPIQASMLLNISREYGKRQSPGILWKPACASPS